MWKIDYNRRIEIALVVSLLFHILFFLSFDGLRKQISGIVPEITIPKEIEPLTFEIVENPNADNTDIPKKSNLLSDRNSRARNPELSSLPVNELPNLSGIFDIKEIPVPSAAASNHQSVTDLIEKEQQKTTEEVVRNQALLDDNSYVSREINRTPKFSRDALLKSQFTNLPSSTAPEENNLSLHNPDFRAEDLGGFSLNTYKWDFAPYLLELKKRIERNIYPPPAFTLAGIIEGKVTLRFTISLEGELINLELLNYDGHKSLVNTSEKAIELSSPFRPLPDNFPEKELIITGRFFYIINRSL